MFLIHLVLQNILLFLSSKYILNIPLHLLCTFIAYFSCTQKDTCCHHSEHRHLPFLSNIQAIQTFQKHISTLELLPVCQGFHQSHSFFVFLQICNFFFFFSIPPGSRPLYLLTTQALALLVVHHSFIYLSGKVFQITIASPL